MAQLEGGAKQTIHYTDVSPALVILAVTKGGNHIFGHVIGADGSGLPKLKTDALQEALTVFQNELLSPVYIGWVKGYMDEERARFEKSLEQGGVLAQFAEKIHINHPRHAFASFADDLRQVENSHWLA